MKVLKKTFDLHLQYQAINCTQNADFLNYETADKSFSIWKPH